MNEELANRIIDLQAEITALRGAVRMLLHNAYNADDTALANHPGDAFQDDRFESGIPNERSSGTGKARERQSPVCLTRFNRTVTKRAA